MNQKTITILQLYPRDMNIYGDWGNVLVLHKRLEWHGYTPKLLSYDPGDTFPDDVDIVVGGGGQDSGQDIIQNDLLTRKAELTALAGSNTPMLLVCGLYQLFGNFFKTGDGHVIKGIGVLDIETYAGNERLIGNITTRNDQFGQIIGYENHSGQTMLGNKVKPLGVVERGAGNNGKDHTEGARYKNIIGTYLHGSLLPKNPAIADFIIEEAIKNKYGSASLGLIDDRFSNLARQRALKRPR